jgi:LysM repeat protein
MLVRAVRSCQRGSTVYRVAAAALAFSLARSGLAAAQEPVSRPATHTVKRGDTLWDIAKMYLSDPFLWPEIYRLNTDVVEDPHWIYPGEVLKLPGAQVVAAAPAPAATPAADTTRPQPIITTPAPVAVDTTPRVQETPRPAVRWGEYIAAPWVDQRGGPRDWGTIMGTADLSPHINSGDRANFDPYDKVLFSPPPGAPNAPRARYLAYVLGPLIEDFGQIVIPTGIVEVDRPSENGDAGVAHVVRVFNQLQRDQRLIPYDTSIMSVVGRPAPVTNGRSGRIRWMFRSPVLPDLQRYLVFDISRRDGIGPGDQIELYQPRLRGEDGRLGTPELSIGRAQVVRVTPFGATAIVTSIERPKVEEGTTVRVSAKMP